MSVRSYFAAGVLALASHTAWAAPSLFFLIDGDTFTQPFSITNQSSAGELVTRFQLNLTGTGLIFDTVDGGPPGNATAGVPFTPQGGSDVITGLLGPVFVADGASLLDISFTHFNAGESFLWDIDVDGASGSPITVTGDMMVGAQAIIDFSDGQRLLGVLRAVDGNLDASQFVVTGITTTPPNGVPEPGSLGLAVLALAAVGARVRRRGRPG